jgi:ParB family chromosome partitioning protein
MDPAGLEELRDSIASHGVLQPIMVRKSGDRYQIVSGERRWRASRLAGLQRIPAVVRDDITDHEMLELALVENVQRRDLDPIERARGFQAMMNTLQLTQEAVADKVGLKRATVANHVRLLDLPERVQTAIGQGLIGMGHARALLGLKSPLQVDELLDRCVRKDMSVREVERFVREQATPRVPPDQDRSGTAPGARPSWQTTAERRLQSALATKVSIQADVSYRGEIRLEFSHNPGFYLLLYRLAPPPRLE